MDRVGIDRFGQRITAVISRFCISDWRMGRYRPLPVRRVEIDKPGSTAKRPAAPAFYPPPTGYAQRSTRDPAPSSTDTPALRITRHCA